MAEAATNQPEPKDRPSVVEQKEVAYYSALVQAWIESKMEFDRSLLTLSAGGIGLLITLLSTVGVKNGTQIIISTVALVLFVVCILLVLKVLELNGPYVTSIANGNKCETSKYDEKLGRLDLWTRRVFKAGVLVASVYSILLAYDSLAKKEESAMFDEERDEPQFPINNEGFEKSLRGLDTVKESLRGLNMLSPETPDTSIHSLQGINGLDPSVGGAGQSPISGQQSGDSGEKSSEK